MTAIALAAAQRTFDGGRGIAGATARVERGRAVAVLGPSGSGKSTLLAMIAGVLAPTSGSVRTLGEIATQLGRRDYRRHRARIGLLYQADNLTPGLRVAHNVLMGRLGQWSTARALLSLVRPRRRDLDDVHEALSTVELEDRLWAWPDELSGGEQQRVALARLVLQQPELWIADEPTAGLDVRLRRDVLQMLLALARRHGATVVVAIHDLELVDAGFDEIWGLRAGQLVLREPPQTLHATALRRLYETEAP